MDCFVIEEIYFSVNHQAPVSRHIRSAHEPRIRRILPKTAYLYKKKPQHSLQLFLKYDYSSSIFSTLKVFTAG